MIPKTIEAWQQDMWNFEFGDFWEKATNKKLKPLTLYRNIEWDPYPRDIHEMAHLVTCKDEDILDACWGVNEFITPATPHLPKDAFLKELEVITVEAMINFYFNPKGEQRLLYEGKQLSVSRVIKSIDKFNFDTTYEQKDDAVRTAKHKWTIESIWKELNRKYELIRSAR